MRHYKDYAFIEFSDIYEYIDFVCEIKLPWIEDKQVRVQIATQKAKELHIALQDSDFDNLTLLENKFNQTFYKQNLDSKMQESKIDSLLKELRILASATEEKSSLENIPEPLRLEYLLALILGKKYGSKNLESNLIYNENGEPLSYAQAGKTDLLYENFSFEATMIKNRNQQLNSETTSVARHFYEAKNKMRSSNALCLSRHIFIGMSRYFLNSVRKNLIANSPTLAFLALLRLWKKARHLASLARILIGCLWINF